MDTASDNGFQLPPIREVSTEQPWQWLAAGWRDMLAHPGFSLAYGVFFALACLSLTGLLVYFDLIYLLLPLAAGLVFVGPLLAVGLYELSRRVETGLPVSLGAIAFVRTKSSTQLAFMGLILVFFILAWVRFATLLFALFFGEGFGSLAELVNTLLFTGYGLGFLALGTAIGAALSFLVFAISVVSIPRLMAQDTDIITSIATSIKAVRRNFWPMVLWAWLIAVLMGIGVVTLFLGLIIIFPLIGHATWHAYRAVVDEPV